MYICSLIGVETRNAVVCAKTGLVFDKDSIFEYLKINSVCPITSVSMSLNDFVEIKAGSNGQLLPEAADLAESVKKIRADWESLQKELNAKKLQEDNLKKELLYIRKQNSQAREYIASLLGEKETIAAQYQLVAEKMVQSEGYKQRQSEKQNDSAISY